MKKLLLSLTLLVGFTVHAAAETVPSAKAIYCEANTTLYFTYDDEPYNTFTAYEQLDGNTPTKVYDNINSKGYFCAQSGYTVWDDILWDPQLNNNPWSKDYRKDISTVKILNNFINWKPTGLDGYFFYLEKLSEIIGGENINTSEVLSLENMCLNCRSLTNLDFLNTWDVSKVTNLDRTFSFCISLTDINGLANWNITNVEKMRAVLAHCSSLTDIRSLANWDLSNVKSVMEAFSSCRTLADLSPISGWDMSGVIEMAYMFDFCSSLSDLEPLSGWDVGNVQDMGYLFGRTNIKEVKALSNWNISSVRILGELFLNCKNLTNIEGLEKWNTSNVEYLHQTFDGCKKLTSLAPIYNWNTEKVKNIYRIFTNCESLTGTIDLSKWDLSAIGSGTITIRYLPTATQSWLNSSQLSDSFNGCSGITGVFMGKGNVGKEENITRQNTFQGCPKLRFIDFSGCTDTYGNILGAKRKTYGNMFYDVPRTTVIYLPQGNTEAEESDHENVVYTASDGTLQCDKYYSEDKVDIELPYRFHADLATYERPFSKTYAGVILPYPIKINDDASDEFQPFILQEEYVEQMFFKGSDNVPANTPFVFKRKGSTNMKFAMEDVWVESTYDVNGETSDNIDPEFRAWKSQGFYVSHEIEPENGKFKIPTMDDYVGSQAMDNVETVDIEYDCDKVYYIASNKFYRTDPSTLYLDPHRILYYGQWEKFSGDISGARPAAFTIEELDENSPAITAIQEAELRLDESRAAAIYDANGNRLSETKRGVNILRMADGSVKKVLRK